MISLDVPSAITDQLPIMFVIKIQGTQSCLVYVIIVTSQ